MPAGHMPDTKCQETPQPLNLAAVLALSGGNLMWHRQHPQRIRDRAMCRVGHRLLCQLLNLGQGAAGTGGERRRSARARALTRSPLCGCAARWAPRRWGKTEAGPGTRPGPCLRSSGTGLEGLAHLGELALKKSTQKCLLPSVRRPLLLDSSLGSSGTVRGTP